jgi:hypothetical protein
MDTPINTAVSFWDTLNFSGDSFNAGENTCSTDSGVDISESVTRHFNVTDVMNSKDVDMAGILDHLASSQPVDYEHKVLSLTQLPSEDSLLDPNKSVDKEGQTSASSTEDKPKISIHQQNRDFGDRKPPYSYLAMITMALESSTAGKMTLNEIYDYIMEIFTYYKQNTKSWQNSVRHNLSVNDCFIKVQKGPGGRGNYWSLHPESKNMFEEGSLQRRSKKFKVSPKEKSCHRSWRKSRRCSSLENPNYTVPERTKTRYNPYISASDVCSNSDHMMTSSNGGNHQAQDQRSMSSAPYGSYPSWYLTLTDLQTQYNSCQYGPNTSTPSSSRTKNNYNNICYQGNIEGELTEEAIEAAINLAKAFGDNYIDYVDGSCDSNRGQEYSEYFYAHDGSGDSNRCQGHASYSYSNDVPYDVNKSQGLTDYSHDYSCNNNSYSCHSYSYPSYNVDYY